MLPDITVQEKNKNKIVGFHKNLCILLNIF